MASLEVRGITKTFGKLTAVDDLSFEVEAGQVCAFIGPNGAGKTTTMRICATLDVPDRGEVFVDGRSVLLDPRGVRSRLGFMPDVFGTYPNTTVLEYLDFFARAYGLRGARRSRALREVTEFTGLALLASKEVTSLSKGMRQRLCLGKTLLHDPAVMILDEPASGLDPRARVELRELVRALASMGKAILISSHILTELSEVCDSVAVLEGGRLCATGTLDDIAERQRVRNRVFVRCLAEPAELERALVELPGVQSPAQERGGVSFELEGGEEELASLLSELVRRDLRPIEFAPEELDLEDLFLSLTEGRLQ